MAMLANDTPAHAVGNTKALPDLEGSLSRREHRAIRQPFEIGIAQQQKGAWTYHCTEFVLVVRQTVDAIAVEMLFLTLQEPVVVGLVKVLQILTRQCRLM